MGNNPLYLKFWVKLTQFLQKRRFSVDFRSASAVISSDKRSIKSTTRFPMSLRRTAYVASKRPKGYQERKTAVFRIKLHFSRRKSATKFLCVKTVSDKVVRHTFVQGRGPDKEKGGVGKE